MESCRKKDFQAATPINFTIPAGFPQPTYNFSRNPLSEEAFQLGRKLFYEGRLSKDGKFPCSSCHQQVASFTTFEHDRSHGFGNSHTLRNAPALSNLAWYPYFNQDGSGKSLEGVSLAHILHPNEMAETIPGIINKLKDDEDYKNKFRAAYGSATITSDRILNALSQFLVNMVSANSKYDRVKKGEAGFTNQEQSGYTIFQAKCASCHKEPLFTDFSFRNIGLPVDPHLNDFGRMFVTGNKNDSLKFRVTSLRNIEFSSYYAHDGRFSMFRHMIQHYRNGVVPSPTLDPQLANGITLTNAEENDLVVFLRTLNDSSYITNPRFGE
jgi:cytochrome c peroxidase